MVSPVRIIDLPIAATVGSSDLLVVSQGGTVKQAQIGLAVAALPSTASFANVSVTSTLDVSHLTVSSAATVGASLTVGSLVVSSGATVTGVLTAGSLVANSGANITGAFSVTGSGTISGAVTFGSSTTATTINSINPSLPNISAFAAYSSANQNNVTGDSTTVTVQFTTELLDRVGDFSSNTFTARTAGAHSFSGGVGISGLTSNHTAITLTLATSINTYKAFSWTLSTAVTAVNIPFSVVTPMVVGETMVVQVNVAGSSGQVDILGSTAAVHDTFFTGQWIG